MNILETIVAKMAARAKNEKRDKVMSILSASASSGMTCGSIAKLLNMQRDFVSPLLPKLERLGIVERNGWKRVDNGSTQQIWFCNGFAKDYIPQFNDKEE